MPKLASRRVALQLAAIAAIFSAMPVAGPAVAADPAQIVQSTAQQVIEIVKTKTGADRQAAILGVLQTNFDMLAMGRSALGTHWNQATESERTRFLKAVATAEAKAYSERFGQYGGQTLTIGKVTPRANGVMIVDSRLNQTSGQPIKLEWEVRNDRIADVKVEGVSMVMTRRSDFNSYIQNNGGKVEPLVLELEARAAR
ncbi:phospholipid-binding protein MlaC [Reyranella sp.]|uniref:MlaC/ttg2D family ABC transporter substrate-binding protein n=1 Tax=Reyranella sp. TaxID=1929291 RepID=UPI00260E8EE9|nr:ABC transporter substrate-binding protein [Reyranella sp.]HQS13953.1 ABC transporter substrate-binding protein [Reyranella sp.]HQT10438.1 ABC transporter substrate-binding protein [Reyranella sp.]